MYDYDLHLIGTKWKLSGFKYIWGTMQWISKKKIN